MNADFFLKIFPGSSDHIFYPNQNASDFVQKKMIKKGFRIEKGYRHKVSIYGRWEESFRGLWREERSNWHHEISICGTGAIESSQALPLAHSLGNHHANHQLGLNFFRLPSFPFNWAKVKPSDMNR